MLPHVPQKHRKQSGIRFTGLLGYPIRRPGLTQSQARRGAFHRFGEPMTTGSGRSGSLPNHPPQNPSEPDLRIGEQLFKRHYVAPTDIF
jgi:hypothetical protein